MPCVDMDRIPCPRRGRRTFSFPARWCPALVPKTLHHPPGLASLRDAICQLPCFLRYRGAIRIVTTPAAVLRSKTMVENRSAFESTSRQPTAFFRRSPADCARILETAYRTNLSDEHDLRTLQYMSCLPQLVLSARCRNKCPTRFWPPCAYFTFQWCRNGS